MNKLTLLVSATEGPTSLSNWVRGRRWNKLKETFPHINDMRVLDLGGTPAFWKSAPVTPAHVTVVNLSGLEGFEGVESVQGDACDLPKSILGGGYDLVVSNSLIEHVGGHSQRLRLADSIHAAADHHWVQTPYRYFPIEPHWLAPGIQFLPFAAKVRATMLWKFGCLYTTDRAEAVEIVHEVELLSITQMRSYFPDSTIWYERFSGLVKSVVAIR